MYTYLGLYIIFNTISIISGRWQCEYERRCAMKYCLGAKSISPQRDSNPRPRDPSSGTLTLCKQTRRGLIRAFVIRARCKQIFSWGGSYIDIFQWAMEPKVTCTWPIWPPCPHMVNTLKNLVLLKQKAAYPETWQATSGTRVLPNLFKWWPWADTDLFYGKVKVCPLCFCMGERSNRGFSETMLVYVI